MTAQKRNFYLGLFLTWLLMSLSFFFVLPVMGVDRLQENWYLGVPFERMKTGTMWIDWGDPFPMNGPHVMFILAKAAHLTNGLLAVRLIQWVVCLVAATLLWFLLNQLTSFSKKTLAHILFFSLTASFAWVSAPGGLIYPVQTNGMLWGFACLVAGLILLDTKPIFSMLLFGFAYAAKAQYIALFPCVIFFRLFLDRPKHKPLKHFLFVARDAILFFLPTMLILPIIFSAFGGFRSLVDVKNYVFEGPNLLAAQFKGLFLKIFSHEAPILDIRKGSSGIIQKEFSGFGMLARFHVALSLLSGIFFLFIALKERFLAGGKKPTISRALALLSLIVCVYWLNYFKFYQFPYWYNTLAVLFFNVFWLPFVWIKLNEFCQKNSFYRANEKLIFIFSAGFIGIILFVQLARFAHAWNTMPPGDGLRPYQWMLGKPWNGDIN